ncbi:MAG: ABC transporter ATP-binding protein [Planctomycetota bacterium]
MSDSDVLIKVDGVGKKFCRDLKRSLWYGVKDLAAEVTGRPGERDNLRKDEFWAVDDVSFEVRRGECLGLIGHNGAGKSTLLKMLNGLIKPDRGSITMRGRIGALIELGAGFNPILTGRENVYVNGSVLGMTKTEIDRKFDAILDFAEIGDFIDAPVQTYSSGMKVRLGFAVAAQLEPDVLLIDEVLAVGDVNFRMKCFSRLLEMLSNDVAVILVSHNMNDVNRICSSGYVMERGSMAFNGPTPTAMAHYYSVGITSHSSDAGFAGLTLESTSTSNGHCKTDEFETGDPVEIELVINSAMARRARVRVAFESPQGHLAGLSSVASGLWIDLREGRNTVRLTLPKCPFLIGALVLSCGIYGETINDVYLIRNNIGTVRITGPRIEAFGFSNDGLVALEHHWSVGRRS